MRHVHRSILVDDKSSIGEARRAVHQVAQALGFNDERRNDIGIAATEAATNTLLHGAGGEFLICPFVEGNSSWIDLFAIDSGPGIHDVGRAMQDGMSSIGTAGQGIGAISRLSNESSIYSQPGKGTVFWSRFRMSDSAASTIPNGLINIPIHGETACGDSYFVHIDPARSVYMMVDGLGHGVGAAEAAHEAVTTLTHSFSEPGVEILTRSHDALKKTRGAAMSVAIVDHDRLVLTYVGVGNISALLFGGENSRTLVSQNGTLGAALPRVPQEFTYPITRETTLMMSSDGLSSKAAPTGYPGLKTRHPALIAGVLFRDFRRKRDDATIMVAPLGGAAA